LIIATRSNPMPLEFPPETKKRLIEAIQGYWRDETDEDIGLLRAERIYDFFLSLIGASAYNRGVTDARAFLETRLIDLEIELLEVVRYDTE
jgi:uncharacterized protein (DUF2164 family)